MFLPLSVYCAQCTPGQSALARLKGYLSYESTVGSIAPGPNKFGYARTNNKDLFLQYAQSHYVSGSTRRVYVLAEGKPVFPTSCSAGSDWTRCGVQSFESFYAERDTGPSTSERSCELVIPIPKWRPSPNSAIKRKLASEVLQELISFGYTDAKQIYARDFNIHDPELDFLIIDANGHEAVQGCDFNADTTPHCACTSTGRRRSTSSRRR